MIKSVIKGLYVVKDKVSEIAGPIFATLNKEHAIRTYCIAMQKEMCLDDFDLIYIGVYDEYTQRITSDVQVVKFDKQLRMNQFRAMQSKYFNAKQQKLPGFDINNLRLENDWAKEERERMIKFAKSKEGREVFVDELGEEVSENDAVGVVDMIKDRKDLKNASTESETN